MRSSVLPILILTFVATLPGHTSSPTPVKPSAGPLHSATYRNRQLSGESDGVAISVIDLGKRMEASLARKGHHDDSPEPHTTPRFDNDVSSTQITAEEGEKEELTTWSIAWYLTLLSAFIVFFVFIGLMEVFCRKRGRFSYCCGRTNPSGGASPRLDSSGDAGSDDDLSSSAGLPPPPPYDLFKPPSYNTLFPSTLLEKKPDVTVESPPAEQLVYVINVHSGRGVS